MTFLDYFSLGIVIAAMTLVFYGFIYIHDIPYQIAKKRAHPHAEAIHIACWLSLFTLHALWPLVFIWAVMKQQPLEVSVAGGAVLNGEDLRRRLDGLEQRLQSIESSARPRNPEPKTHA